MLMFYLDICFLEKCFLFRKLVVKGFFMKYQTILKIYVHVFKDMMQIVTIRLALKMAIKLTGLL